MIDTHKKSPAEAELKIECDKSLIVHLNHKNIVLHFFNLLGTI